MRAFLQRALPFNSSWADKPQVLPQNEATWPRPRMWGHRGDAQHQCLCGRGAPGTGLFPPSVLLVARFASSTVLVCTGKKASLLAALLAVEGFGLFAEELWVLGELQVGSGQPGWQRSVVCSLILFLVFFIVVSQGVGAALGRSVSQDVVSAFFPTLLLFCLVLCKQRGGFRCPWLKGFPSCR